MASSNQICFQPVGNQDDFIRLWANVVSTTLIVTLKVKDYGSDK